MEYYFIWKSCHFVIIIMLSLAKTFFLFHSVLIMLTYTTTTRKKRKTHVWSLYPSLEVQLDQKVDIIHFHIVRIESSIVMPLCGKCQDAIAVLTAEKRPQNSEGSFISGSYTGKYFPIQLWW